jgi:hypothetical protein
MSQDSSVSIVMGYGLEGCGRFPAGSRDFSLHHVQTGSGTHPASYQMGTRALFLGIEPLVNEADHSRPFSAKIKNGRRRLLFPPPHVFVAWCLIN